MSQLVQQLQGEALGSHQGIEFPPSGVVCAGDLPRQTLAVYIANEQAAGGAEQFRSQTGVVRVQMGQEDVRVGHVYAQLRQTGFQSRPAFLLPKARVYQQIPVAANEVGVQVFEGVPRQGDRGCPVEVGGDLGDHGGRLLSRVFSIITQRSRV